MRPGAFYRRTCRQCGCTDSRACVDSAGFACHWVGEDLCSACNEAGRHGVTGWAAVAVVVACAVVGGVAVLAAAKLAGAF